MWPRAAAGNSDASCSSGCGHLGRSSPMSRSAVSPEPAVDEEGSEITAEVAPGWAISIRD